MKTFKEFVNEGVGYRSIQDIYDIIKNYENLQFVDNKKFNGKINQLGLHGTKVSYIKSIIREGIVANKNIGTFGDSTSDGIIWFWKDDLLTKILESLNKKNKLKETFVFLSYNNSVNVPNSSATFIRTDKIGLENILGYINLK